MVLKIVTLIGALILGLCRIEYKFNIQAAKSIKLKLEIKMSSVYKNNEQDTKIVPNS